MFGVFTHWHINTILHGRPDEGRMKGLAFAYDPDGRQSIALVVFVSIFS